MRQKTKHFYEFGGYRLDLANRLLWRGSEVVSLPPKAFDILLVLVEESGQVLTKEKLMQRVWPDSFVEEANLSNHISNLRKALSDDKSGVKYIETISRRGYRFVAKVAEIQDEPTAVLVEERTRTHIVVEERQETTTVGNDFAVEQPGQLNALPGEGTADSQIKRKIGRQALLVLGVVIALTVVIYFWATNKSKPEVTGLGAKSIAVLPFKPLDEGAGDEYLGLGMADSLITKISNLKQIIVRPTSAILKYGDLSQDPLAAGREQQVEALLIGKIQRAGDKVRVSVQLVRVSDGAMLWGREFNESFTNILSVQDSISEHIAQALKLSLKGEDQQRLATHYTDNIEAYQLYLRGRYFWNKRSKEGLQKALDYFQQAIDKDANYALAYSGLADTYYILGQRTIMPPSEAFPPAKQAAMKAVEIDDTLCEAHTSLAIIKSHYDRDVAGAELEYQRAIEINPNYATAHHWYSRHLMQCGRVDDAIAEAKKAHTIDPLSLIINNNLAELYYYAQQYDESLKHLQKTREMDSTFRQPFVYGFHYFIYRRKGMVEAAIPEYVRFVLWEPATAEKESKIVALLKDAYRVGGDRGLSLKQLEIVKQEASPSEFPMHMAELYTRLGETDKAIYWLNKAADASHPALPYLFIDPDFESLRADARFQNLLRRIGFPL